MPAFYFEKLPPPNVGGPTGVPIGKKPPPASKPRRLFGHMIDRFVEARIRKNLRKERDATPRQPE